MQLLQRSFSVLLTIFFFVFAVTLVAEEKENYGYKQWENIQINRFLEKMSKEGKCSYEQYQLLYKALNKYGRNVTITVKEYQKEVDVKGNRYWYLISWEEMKELLIQKEEYIFQKDSVLELCVKVKEGNIEKQEKYYIISKGTQQIVNNHMEYLVFNYDAYMVRRMV